MIPEARIRHYREDDLDAIVALDQTCFEESFRFDRASMRSFAEAHNALTLIAEAESGELLSFIIVHLEHSRMALRGYIVTLDVASSWRRAGLAAELVRSAESQVAAAGAFSMELHVFTGNHGAIHFYERLGYRRIATRRGFYGEAGLDAYVYRKHLGGRESANM